ncbi:MAG: hypothetical protein ACOY4K_06465 [Pseudomonadota bacterium]
MKDLSTYTPAGLYSASWRMSDGWTVEETVAEYMRLHPTANEDEVRAEVEKAAA